MSNNNNRRVRRRLYVPFNLNRYRTDVKNIKNVGYDKNVNSKYTNLPREIGSFKQLEILWLNGHNLTSIPKEIGNLKNLRVLMLGDNKLLSIPKGIYNLKNLTHLSLGGNDITSIPKEIDNLKNLTHLSLGGNDITSIPKEIGNLKNLTHLDLSYNNLESIPKEIGKLKNLRYLELDNNKLTSIPKEIGKLKKLRELSLKNNKLTSLPREIEDIPFLYKLDVKLNPGLKGISSELEKKGLNINKNNYTKFINYKYYTNQLSTVTVKRKNLPRLPPKIRENIARKVNKPPHNAKTEVNKMNIARSSLRAYNNKQKVLTRRLDTLFETKQSEINKWSNWNNYSNNIKTLVPKIHNKHGNNARKINM